MSHDMVIVTPENAEIRVPLAGIFSRAGAFVYDLFFQFVGFIVFQVLFLYAADTIILRQGIRWLEYSGFMPGLYMIFTLIWLVGYHVCFEIFNHGRTPGKTAFAIRVIMQNGQEIRFFNSFLRTLMRVADFLPVLFLAGLFSSIATENQQRIGDLLANTVVIRDKNG